MVSEMRISAGAFGPMLPRRDLFLSPDHAVFAADVLIQQARRYKTRREISRGLRLIARADLELRGTDASQANADTKPGTAQGRINIIRYATRKRIGRLSSVARPSPIV